ncbi:MAG: GNAT family N-acetyltransferase [Trebonia sp.]
MEVTLRPATAEEFDGYRSAMIAGYAEEIAASGSLPPDAARKKAEQDTERALPDGLGTKGQLIYRVIAGEEPVGWLWLAVPAQPDNPRMAWVNNVEIGERFRGKGYGRQAMLLAERAAREHGMTSLGLNVHGTNATALALYDGLGYQVMTQQMNKPVLR